VPATQNDYRVDDRNHNDTNVIHIGTDPLHVGYGPRHDVGRHYDGYPGRYHYRPYRPHYNPSHYYYGYRPIYYPGCGWYSPWYGYGYTYTSVYLSEPYVVHVYDDDEPTVYYSEQSPAVESTTATYESSAVTPLSAPSTGEAYPAPDGETYQPLPATAPNSLVGDGNAAFTAGRYDDARRLYTRAVMADERDGYAKMLLGWASFAVGDYDGAAAAIRRALLTTDDLVNYPMDVRTFYSDAAVLNHQIGSLVQFTQSRPDDREAEFVLAYLYYSVGQAERSASVFNGLVDRDRNDTLAATVRDAVVRASRRQVVPPKP
jgi:tetratricopeptide (TPR) repeat protein